MKDLGEFSLHFSLGSHLSECIILPELDKVFCLMRDLYTLVPRSEMESLNFLKIYFQ